MRHLLLASILALPFPNSAPWASEHIAVASPPTVDTFISHDNGCAPNGCNSGLFADGDSLINVARRDGCNREKRTLLKFDLSGFSSVSSVECALLRVYVVRQNEYRTHSMTALRILEDWSTSSVNWCDRLPGEIWSDQGGAGDSATASTISVTNKYKPDPPGTGFQAPYNQWVEWDVTAILEDWLLNGVPNFGFLILQDPGAPDDRNQELHMVSKDHPLLGSEYAPRLEVRTVTCNQPSWETVLTSGPTEITGHTAIHDPIRDRMLLFGGEDLPGPTPTNQVRSLDLGAPTSWTNLATQGTPPSPRVEATAIYDSKNDRMIVFGGWDGSFLSDTWELDLASSPATWIQLGPIGSPPAGRYAHTAVYDPNGERMVVFGGYDGTRLNDTWELTLSGAPTWVELYPLGTSPVGRSSHVAVYDPPRSRMIVHGGSGPGVTANTYALDLVGTPTWTTLGSTGVEPLIRYAHTAVYSAGLDAMILFGGEAEGARVNDCLGLDLDNGNWFAVNPTGRELPPPRYTHVAISDPIRDTMWLHGGSDGVARHDTWRLTLESQSTLPAPTLLALAATCSERIEFSWTSSSPFVESFELQARPANLPNATYQVVATIPGTESYIEFVPADRWVTKTYRLESIKSGFERGRSNEVTPTTGSALLKKPSSVVAKSLGDASSIRVYIAPPEDETGLPVNLWGSTTGVQVELLVSGASVSSQFVAAPPSGIGAVYVDFSECDPGVSYTPKATLINGCLQSQMYTVGSPVSPRHAPILFVHGIGGSAENWGGDGSEGFGIGDEGFKKAFTDSGYVALQLYSTGFTNRWSSWTRWVSQLAEKLEYLLRTTWSADEVVDIVAHSQGGLAARGLIEWNLRSLRPRVRTLFMLGTPNHGSEFFTRHRGEVCTGYCPGLAEASGDLLPSSLALGRLNGILSPPDQECADSPLESLHHGSVRYYTVAGTKYNKLICPELKFWRRDCLATGNCDGDGVVEWRSARLRSLTATNNKCPQWRDVDVGEELSHARLFGLSTGVGTPYLESSLLAGHVINALKSGSATIDGSGCLPNSPSELLSTSLPDSSSNVYVEQLGILTASLQPGESDSLSVQVDPADTMAVVVRGSSATFLISLMDPDSTTYFAPDTSTTAWLHYVVEDSSRTKVFIVDLPAPGSWVLAVGAELGSVDVDISVEWVSVGSGTGLSTVVTPMGSDGDSLIVVAQFIGEAPVTSSATGSVVWPDGSMDPVPMADDGFGGDEVAGDHCYWGYVLAPDQHGAAEVVIRGTGTLLGGAEFERLNSQFVSLSYVPELRVESTTIEWSPQIPTTESLVDLGVRIRNLGFADAESLLVIATQTLTDQVLASAVTSIMAGDSTTVQLSWLPTVAGDNEIRIELADAVDGDPTDNFATVKIPVASSTQPVGILNPPEPGNRPLMLYPYPNPASKSVRLQYYLSDRGQVEVAVFDIQGRLVRQLVSAILDSGEHMVDWDGTSRTGVRVASGIYFMHVATSQDRATRKVLLIR